jgi:hypothetical protein
LGWDKTLPQPTLDLLASIYCGGKELLRNMLFSFFIFFVEFLGHFYEFLSSDSSSICQKSGSGKSTLLSVGRVKLVYEQVARKALTRSTVLNATFRTRIQFAFAPERLSILIATSRAARLFLSVQENARSTVCATRCDKLLVQQFRLEYQQIGSVIIDFGLLPFLDDLATLFLFSRKKRHGNATPEKNTHEHKVLEQVHTCRRTRHFDISHSFRAPSFLSGNYKLSVK